MSVVDPPCLQDGETSVAVERMRWRMAKYFYDHAGDPDFDALCRTFGVPIIEARKLALAFALS